MAYQFDIGNDSPEIAYYPFVNLEPSSNLTAGWQLLYTDSGAATSPGEVGVGTSYHYTSLNGASLEISWNGTGIDLVGSVSNALYNISLDGIPCAYFPDPANSILASLDSLENTNHTLLLTTIVTNSTSPDAFLTFNKATITYAPPAEILNATATSQGITDSEIAFMGQWSYVADSSGDSMHVSNSAGDTAVATFLGSAITVYGLTSSYSGQFAVILDNITSSLSARSSYNNSDSLLFYATDLPQDIVHHIEVINQENHTLALRAGGLNITFFGHGTTSRTSSSSSSSLPAGTIAAIVLAAVLFLVIVGIVYYVFWIRRRARAIRQHDFLQGGRQPFGEKGDTIIEQAANISPPSGEELESTSLSTSKGYGFGLGLRRGFLFPSRKNKSGSTSSGRSRSGTVAHAEFHPMTFQRDRDEKRLSIFTLTEDLPVLTGAPESEKLAPGWCNPVARAPPSFIFTRHWEETQGLPELHADQVGPEDDEDADVKTLTSRQDETIAATLSLSPRISEALATIGQALAPDLADDTQDCFRLFDEGLQRDFLQVRDVSPFRVDVSGILGTRKAKRDSGRTSGSGSSTWSKVRARLYRRAHQDDGRQSCHADRQETSSSSGPESVPVVMHESGFVNPPSEATPASGSYSFLDLTLSHGSLRRHSKTTTLSSAPAEHGHGAKGTSTRSDHTSIRMVRVERDDALAPKPDAPSTASGGSHPSDNSGTQNAPSAPTMHTQTSSPFPFPITIPSSSHIAQPPDHGPERHATPSPPPILPSQSDQYLQVPQIISPVLSLPPATSPTESVPFSVSEIHFRHSFSDHAGLDSRRGSVSSVLPPHPPLPHLDGSQASTPTFPPPPPYIVQRVLGLPTSPLSPLSPLSFPTSPRTGPDSPISTLSGVRRPGTAPSQTLRVGSLLGPRPPATAGAGSVRGSAAPQLPMQGGRSSLRSPR